MKYKTLTLAIALSTLSACGGSGGNSDAPLPETSVPEGSEATTTFNGQAADGYLSNALACLDMNTNDLCDADEPSGITDEQGNFSFDAPESDIAEYPVVVEAIAGQTIDSDNPGVAIDSDFTLTAPAGSDFVSPLTTLVNNILKDSPGLTAEEAADNLASVFGLDSDPMADYIAAGETSDHEKAQKITKVLAQGYAQAQTDAGEDLNDENFSAVLSAILDDIYDLAEEITIAESDNDLPEVDVIGDDGIDALVEEENAEAAAETINSKQLFETGYYEINTDEESEYHYLGRRLVSADDEGVITSTEEYLDGQTWKLEEQDEDDHEDTDIQVVLRDDWVAVEDVCVIQGEDGNDAQINCGQNDLLVRANEVDLEGVTVESQLIKAFEISGEFNANEISEFEEALADVTDTFSAGDLAYNLSFERYEGYQVYCDAREAGAAENTWDCSTTSSDHTAFSDLIGTGEQFWIEPDDEQISVSLGGNASSTSGNLLDADSEVIGTWEKTTVHGEELIIMDVESSSERRKPILAIIKGYVTRGDLEPESSFEEMDFNESAVDSITEAVHDIFPVYIND